MTEKGSGGAAARRRIACVLFVVAISSLPRRAAAEKVIANIDGWQVYTDGRVGGFVSWAYGDGYPQPQYDTDAMGKFVNTPVDSPQEGAGFRANSQQGLMFDPSFTNGVPIPNQGTINMVRLRSGFITNVFGFGVRGPLIGNTTLTGYVQFWAFVENNGRQKNLPNYPDARQGYLKLEGPWGSFSVGRMRALFSRGATDIDVMYAHRWGVGFPGKIDNNGPTVGQLGFGVLGSGFSSAVMYATPVFNGLQLTVGLLDPVQLQGSGAWTRTKYPRPEAELTFERTFMNGWGKLFLFGNGAYQKVYQDGHYVPVVDPFTMKDLGADTTVAGAGFGGRLELGPFRLGVAGHYGQGLGLYYALEASDAAQDKQGNLRTISGAYVQTNVVIRKAEVFAGWGIAQVYLTDYDKKHTELDPRDPRSNDPDPAIKAMANRVFQFSVPKYQMGINAGIVYHVTPALHVDLDFFRAEAAWYAVNGFVGEKQVVWVGNGGMTVNW